MATKELKKMAKKSGVDTVMASSGHDLSSERLNETRTHRMGVWLGASFHLRMIGVVIHAGRVSEEEEMLRDPNAPNDSFARAFKSFRPVPMMASMGSPGMAVVCNGFFLPLDPFPSGKVCARMNV
jgi:hypothetical protein